MQHDKYVENQEVRTHSATNHSPELQFLGTHNKPHCVRGLGKHHHVCFDPKLRHGTCEICCIEEKK